ncbi:choice-of-anchor D domain-containing protein [Aliifodinibius sp. S!AR15-10]|uniref:choice-of-anchor D domain-containing protein n=1 Tax=Aliifodinibius sp. S!AR15-10 TaxID=2950437 RepID=UPI0028651EC0|nr:choice-of-anchor D domain-containing protein [Aliifodinibius sp. S!AR15-10]MDR8392041.1 choice-of-anchor D domain-containing protein [Aliifodinibius sp. S!AR15-10]
MKRYHLFILILPVLLALPISSFAQTELLTNGGAESGSFAGWTNSNTERKFEEVSENESYAPAAKEGTYAFNELNSGDSNPDTQTMYQIVDVTGDASAIDAGNVTIEFSGWLQSNGYDSDEGKFVVKFLDSGNSPIETYDSGYSAPTGGWGEKTDSRTAPVGTRSIRVEIYSKDTGDSGGDRFHNIFFDAISLTKTTASPEIAIEGNSTEISDGDSSPASGDNTDFGSVAAASGTISKSFTIQNTGSASLSLSGSPIVDISGTNSGDFTVTSQPSSSISGGNNDTFTVEFDPSAKGTRTAEISISNNDGDENPYNFSIEGTGSNSVPTSSDSEIFAVSGTEFSFNDSDFPFTDSDGGDALSAVDITTLPGSGTLYLDANSNDTNDGEGVSAGDDISISDLQSGHLRYIPPSNTTGYRAVSFTFKVGDGTEFSSSASTMNITIDENEVTMGGTDGQDAWQFISNPFQTNLSDLFSSIWIQSATNSDAPGADPNIYTFDESTESFSGFTGDLNTTPSAGTGYAVYVYADDDYEAGGTQGDWPKTLSTSGSPHSTPVSIPVSNTDQNTNSTTDGDEGWNLIGNPFGTNLSVDAVISTLQEVDGSANTSAYVWDAASGNYQQLSSGASKALAPFQAFFVRVETSGESGNLNLDNEDRTSNSATYYKEKEPKKRLIFTLEGQDELKGRGGFVFSQNALEGIDPRDAYQLWALPGSRHAMIYSRVNNQNMMQNHLPLEMEDGQETIPLYVQTSESIPLTLTWKRSNLSSEWDFVLHDLETGKKVNLDSERQYEFSFESDKSKVRQKTGGETNPQISSTPRGEEARFELTISKESPVAGGKPGKSIPENFRLKQNYPNPFNPATKIEYAIPNETQVSIKVYNMAGKEVATLVNETKPAGNYEVTWNAKDISSGIYIYHLKSAGQTFTRKMTLIK